MKINALKYSHLRNYFTGIIISAFIVFSSCNNDFLDTQMPSKYIEGDSVMVLSDIQNFEYEFDMHSSGPGTWKLFQFPRWLEVSPKEGVINGNSKVNFQFSLKKEEIFVDLGLYSFPLTFDVENVGMIQNTIVLANVGDPVINTTPAEINADYTFQGQYQIVNSGHGILIWEIINKPEWLNIEMIGGILNSHEYGIWNYSINISGLEPGNYSGKAEIQSNAGQNIFITFNFTIQKNGYYGGYLNGEFIDAKFSETLNQVIVLTKEPNNLLFFKADSPNADTVNLSHVPKSLSISEDEKTIAVGFSNKTVTTFEMQTHTSLRTYSVNAVPKSMEFGNENGLYFLSDQDYTTYLYHLNLINGNIKRANNSEGGLSTIKKVQGKDLLISTKKGYSPDGLFVFDISESSNLDSINEYWMSLNGFWITDDGERLISGSQKVYQTPDYIPGKPWIMDTPPVLSEFNIGENLNINDMIHQSSSGKLFIAYEEGYYRNTTFIKQLNDQTFSLQKTYVATPIPPAGFPPGNTWWTVTSKIFPSPDNSELWIIRQYPASNYELPNLWTLERMELN